MPISKKVTELNIMTLTKFKNKIEIQAQNMKELAIIFVHTTRILLVHEMLDTSAVTYKNS